MNLIWSVVGYVRIKLCGEKIAEFVNKCKTNNIEIRNMKIFSQAVYADVLASSYKLIAKTAEECNVEVKICGRFGLAMKLFLYRNRRAFICSFIVFLVIFMLNLMFVSDIIISGNKYITDIQIKAALSESGIEKGTFLFLINPEEIQQRILKKYTSLSWIWVDMRGTTAFVDVREKTSKPEFYDKDSPCNIVASKSGVITEAISESGTVCIEAGKYVKKGELLIGGVYDGNEFAPVRLVHASGRVLAKTTYTAENDFPLKCVKYHTGKVKNKYSVKLFKNIFETERGLDDGTLLINSAEKKIKIIGNIYLPFTFTKSEYCEIIKKKCTLDKSDTVQYALNELSERLRLIIPHDATVENTEKEVTELSLDKVHVKLTFECIENIASELPIEIQE